MTPENHHIFIDDRSTWARFDTRRPFQDGEPLPWYFQRNLTEFWGHDSVTPTPAEWLYGENTLWATGWFLYSQILRYRATGESEALENARACFRSLNYIFHLCREIQPGLLGKPHGGRAGPTTSYDQSACPVLFYVRFAQELATPDERAEATRNMTEHGEYFFRYDWTFNHHGRRDRIIRPGKMTPSTTKYLACLHAAGQFTGNSRFREAAIEQVRDIVRTGKFPWVGHATYESNHNLLYWAILSDYWNRSEIAAEMDWIHCIKEYWHAAKLARDEQGLLQFGLYDNIQKTFTPHPEGLWPADSKEARNVPSKVQDRTGANYWVSPVSQYNRMLNSACSASLALLARSHGLDDHAHALARQTLLRMDANTLRWWWDAGTLPEDFKPLLNIFMPEVAGMWLSAYWMGRNQQVW